MEDIRNGKCISGSKKSEDWVVVPLRPIAEEILLNRFCGRIPKIVNATFNDLIKKACKQADICEPLKFSYKKGNKEI